MASEPLRDRTLAGVLHDSSRRSLIRLVAPPFRIGRANVRRSGKPPQTAVLSHGERAAPGGAAARPGHEFRGGDHPRHGWPGPVDERAGRAVGSVWRWPDAGTAAAEWNHDR